MTLQDLDSFNPITFPALGKKREGGEGEYVVLRKPNPDKEEDAGGGGADEPRGESFKQEVFSGVATWQWHTAGKSARNIPE